MAPRRARIRYVWNEDAKTVLARRSETLPPLERLARAIAAQARQNAPVRTGAFRKSIKLDAAGNDPRHGWTVPVISTDPFAHIVEFGSVNNPPYRPISRAAQTVARFQDALRASVV